MRTPKHIKLAYWVSTILCTLPMTMSGAAFFMTLPPAVQGMAHLGYPIYILRFLGVAKVLGALAILLGTFPRIKQWAYAGFVFNLLGAGYSHLCSGDGAKTLGPLVVLTLTVVSYACWRKLNPAGEESLSSNGANRGRAERVSGKTALSRLAG
jgi:uncharacterized membrane protein YphA (DoxX/SURF4 family)